MVCHLNNQADNSAVVAVAESAAVVRYVVVNIDYFAAGVAVARYSAALAATARQILDES